MLESDWSSDYAIIGGDFNARTGEKGGILNTPNERTTKRKSKDKMINKKEKKT